MIAKFCTNCGVQVAAATRFCAHCGAKVLKTDVTRQADKNQSPEVATHIRAVTADEPNADASRQERKLQPESSSQLRVKSTQQLANTSQISAQQDEGMTIENIVALLVNFFLPGLGTLFLGELAGVAQIGLIILGSFLVVSGAAFGILMVFVAWIWALISAVNFRKSLNDDLESKENEIKTYDEIERNLENDAYKLYLIKHFKIEHNETLKQYVLENKLYSSLDEVLKAAHDTELAQMRRRQEETLAEKQKKEPPLNPDAKCPNCDAPLLLTAKSCWKCDSLFIDPQGWRPIKIK